MQLWVRIYIAAIPDINANKYRVINIKVNLMGLI